MASYVYRENILLTLIGALAGMGLGRLLLQFIIVTVEVDEICLLYTSAGRQERRQQRILEGAFPAGDRIGQDSIPSLRNGTYSGSGDRDRDKSVLPEKPGEIYGSVTYRSAAVSGF